jgi:hypothetical protein
VSLFELSQVMSVLPSSSNAFALLAFVLTKTALLFVLGVGCLIKSFARPLRLWRTTLTTEKDTTTASENTFAAARTES